jgi:small subunit ribosomal protein S15
MTVLKKEEIFKEFGKNKKDSGSSESQIALFTKRIESLSSHLKNNAKDFNTERSLVKMVGKRRNLLEYLKKTDIERYREIIKKTWYQKITFLVWLSSYTQQ